MATQDTNSLATLVRTHDPDRFLTALFAPPADRDALLTLYAFDRELSRARSVASEPHLALIRLHWWREVVEGAPRRHEVATPLSALLDAGRLPRDLLLRIVDAREIETEPEIATLALWREWLQEGAGGIAVAAATLLGAPSPEEFRPLGAAEGAARVVRWNRSFAAHGRCLLPLDLLAEAGLGVADAISAAAAPSTKAAPAEAGVEAVSRRLIQEGRDWLAKAPSGRLPRAWIAAALPAVLARRDLRRGTASFPGPRGLGDRLAVAFSGAIGRV